MPPTHSTLTLLAASALALGGALAPAPVDAARAPASTSTARPASAARVVAGHLNNPRMLSFARNGTLYVTEAGRGGPGPCQSGPEGPACFGRTGALVRIGNRVSRVVTGLPSLAGHDGSAATGPSGVQALRGGGVAISFGGDGTPANRAALPPSARWLGTLDVATHRGGSWRHHHLRRVADLMAFEKNHDPDHQGVDSDPVGIARSDGRYVVADAAGNDVLSVRTARHIHVLAVFPNRHEPNPAPPPGYISMQAVPTAVAKGPDGAWYVSELTGFPFPQGVARIYRLVPGHRPTVWATGLTNVTDLAWYRGSLYAVQLANHGLLAYSGVPTGSLARVPRGSVHHTVAGHLAAPYGVALRRGAAYVTTCSVCKGAGEVLRIPLH